MARSRSVGARILCAAVFILLETAAIVMLNHNNSMQRLWTMRLSHGFMAKTWGFTQKVRGYFSLAGQNEELALENHRLREMIREYEDAAKAADISLQSVAQGEGVDHSGRRIIKKGTNSQHNYRIQDKGSEDGIVQNSGIMSSKGVIGIVDAVSRHYSYAISFLNTEVNISSRLGGTGAVGPLAWDGKNTDGAILKEIPLQYRYSPGDTVYTSGYSVIFPPDIPLGTAGDASIINGATNEITVNLFQDYTALKFVTIVRNTRAAEIEALEQTREDKDNKRKR